MCIWILMAAALSLLVPQLAAAIDYRSFVSWSDQDLGRINRLEEEISKELRSSENTGKTAVKYEELRSLLDGRTETLPGYLKDTLTLSENIASGKLSGRDSGGATLELRNRLSNVYEFWLLRFSGPLEDHLLKNLHQIVLKNKSSAARLEAAIALCTVGSKTSLGVLEKAGRDSDQLVRKEARSAAGCIRSGGRKWKSYDEVERALKFPRD